MPSVVDGIAKTPTPRLRVGFQLNGSPFTGSRAPIPWRGTAPGPGALLRYGLLNHRMCPPRYTAAPVTETTVGVSPPVQSTQVGICPAPFADSCQRDTVSHMRSRR